MKEVLSTVEAKQPQRKQHEIRTERDRLKAILDSMDDGIYIVGRDYRIEFMNLAMRSALGNGEGRLCHEFFGHEPSECEHCQHGMGSFGPEFRREITFPTIQKIYEVSVSPVHEPDGRISRLHILRDITERKRLEAELRKYSKHLEHQVAEQAERLLQQEKLALLGEISAGLAHEIRTPLGALLTGVKLLEKGGQSDPEKALVLRLLQRETARLERKLSEFLAYAKPRVPRFEKVSLFSLLDELRSILSMDKQLLGETAIHVDVQPADLVWPLDPNQFKEALLNICTNGLQALRGKGRLNLQARSFYEGILEILVRDNGPGIPLDALPHVFKPFYSRRPEGTGLGLAISKDIVESHGGHITITSFPNVSTTFRITLPLHDAP